MAGRAINTRLSPGDQRITWDGVDHLEADGPWLRPWRLNSDRLRGALSPALVASGRDAAGMRLALHTDASALTLRLAVDPARPKPVDVVTGALPDATVVPVPVPVPVPPGANDLRIDLPGEPVDVEVWLPQNTGVRIGDLVLADAELIRPLAPQRFGWIAYGSSLTQSLAAAGPSRTWSALVARRNGWRLRNLGLSSEAHLDQAVARAIRDTPADLITLELGINVYILASLTARTLTSAIGGFLATIRDGHPETPVVVWGPFVSTARENVPNAVGLTLRQVRELVGSSVERLRAQGDRNLHLIDGATLIGDQDGGLLMDGLHPSAAGELVLADRAAAALAAELTDVARAPQAVR